jgi:glucose/arabinose dehydrogenase
MACSHHVLALMLFTLSIVHADDVFVGRPVATGLEIPWDIDVDRDSVMWFTERRGFIYRLDLKSGQRTQVADLRSTTYAVSEAGLTAIKLHPSFPDSPFVYVLATREIDGERYRSVMRLDWDGTQMHDPVELLKIPNGHPTHQGARFLVLPDTTLLVTMGDNASFESPQNMDRMDGKVLRMNLDGTIPDNNPIPGKYIYALGLRNPQGITQLPNGRIFVTDHGGAVHDEINEIFPGANYGWPLVEGPCLETFDSSRCDSLNFVDPFFSTGSTTWALNNIAWYDNDRYPALKNSLLCLALKNSALYQIVLSSDGHSIDTIIQHLDFMYGRLRALRVTDDGRIFVSTSNHEPNGRYPYPTVDDDRILEIVPLLAKGPAELIAEQDTVFSTSLPGDEVEHDVYVRNVGDSVAFMNEVFVGWTAGGAWQTHWNHHGRWFQIPPGESRRCVVRYVPTSHGEHIDRVEFVARERNAGRPVITLIGNTQTGRLRAVTDTVRIETDVLDSAMVAIAIVNDGVAPVTMGTIRVVQGDTSLFHFEYEQGVTVQPSETLQVYATFKPSLVAMHEAVVQVASSGYRSTQFVILANGLVSSVEHAAPLTPQVAVAAPNPFSSDVTITPARETALRIIDIFGRVMWSSQGAPAHRWDGTSAQGERVPCGSYLVVDQEGSVVATLVKMP